MSEHQQSAVIGGEAATRRRDPVTYDVIKRQPAASSGSVNLGAALQVVSNFLDFVANHERPGQFTNSPDYVAARCVIERLCGQEEPVA